MYVELHARSAFSFLEGSSLPENLIAACAKMQMPAMALLDRDGVYGSARFHGAATKVGIKAHVGTEITCETFGFSNTDTSSQISKISSPQKASPYNSFRLPLLVASRAGYQNLCHLITRMKLRSKKGEGSVREHELGQHANGIICLTGGDDGLLAKALANGGAPEGRKCLELLSSIFGNNNVYVELQRHFHREQEARNHIAVDLARSLKLPLLATNDVRYARQPERELCDVFTAIANHCPLATAGKLLSRNSERHLKSPQEMGTLFADLPEAIANTVELSSRLDFTLKDLGYEFPKYPVPQGETMMSFLRERTREGFQQRYGKAAPDLKNRARRQVERELKLVEKLDLAGYFLIVWDLVRFCREQNILVQGRGSAANSAACYSLGITAVDPVGMDLLFERFLSEERGEWPDIDLDLPSGDQRERVIQYVYQRYGERGAAMTANVITYRSRMASREMGKVLGFDPETLDRVSEAVANWEYRDENDALDRRFREAGLDLNHPRLKKYFELCVAVQDLPRHLGQHSGGMVICQGQLDSVVPLEPASMPGRVVVQWDKEDCHDLGIIKVDLLGLGMMAVLEDSLHLIRDHYGEEVDLAHLPADDPEVYSTLRKADTIGMFQIESRAQMACLPRLQPRTFYDIVVQVAIIRPGPIVGQMVNPYLQRRQGRQTVVYPHPSLEPVLERTLGVPLFQEQLLRMAMIAANFTGGEAEELRRAMGFKRSRMRMLEIETKLRSGMERNGISREAQEQIVLSITSFALYGFPESHAASFALIAYASAYLKCHYLAAFTAALLNNQPMGFYRPPTVVKDAQRHGLKIFPIDVMKSDWLCTLEARNSTPALRIGLRYVRGLREEAAQALVRQRTIAAFTSIRDLIHRVPELRKDELNTLAEIGALNSIQHCLPERSEGSLLPPVKFVPEVGMLRLLELPQAEAQSAQQDKISSAAAGNKVPSDWAVTGASSPAESSIRRARLNEQSTLCLPERSEGSLLPPVKFVPEVGMLRLLELPQAEAQSAQQDKICSAAAGNKVPSDWAVTGASSPAESSIRGARLNEQSTLCLPERSEGSLLPPVKFVPEVGMLRLLELPQAKAQSAQQDKICSSTEGWEGLMRSAAGSEMHSSLRTAAPQDDNKLRYQPHRRDALWQVERAVRHSGPLLDGLAEADVKSPLQAMSAEERLVADFRGTGMTVGPHPMQYHRAQLDKLRIYKASELRRIPHGTYLKVGGCVIARQRPGTAKGFVFLSLEDETGVANAIINPQLFQKNRLLITSEQFLMVEGTLQNQDHVISVKASHVGALAITHARTSSHDFH